uniref:Uncharacterized protein n=1 Tax=Cyprinodon variegatus TaxID=28743 RepID=A0A3Q2G0B3_CYPVA
MDRVKSSMQQVPNAIPKVIRRTGGANSLELERENFERVCTFVFKVLSLCPCPPLPLSRPGTLVREKVGQRNPCSPTETALLLLSSPTQSSLTVPQQVFSLVFADLSDFN